MQSISHHYLQSDFVINPNPFNNELNIKEATTIKINTHSFSRGIFILNFE
ncbi:MAG: hypothetical protein OJF59_001360 [Cytophagales bacterium]|nr:MAG: hypothetical protein OJF59_001360 [Cytophagales bacterium]